MVHLFWFTAFVTSAVARDLTASTINSLGNNTLFTRWRPTSHIIAPAGILGDPCGLMYDPTRDRYHMFYQWHPHHVAMGNASWGHVVSQDLITWSDMGGWETDKSVALAPSGGDHKYDGLSIFSGSAQSINLQGEQDGTLTIFYTANKHMPTSFFKRYLPGTESQSIATSVDGGRTWQKHQNNPVIGEPPAGWKVTGFRDFIVEPMPFLDELLESGEPRYYATLGSGIKGVGARMPLYFAPRSDLTKWTFIGSLYEPEYNSSLGTAFHTGTNGANFELSTLISLKDEYGRPHYFVMMGAEYWDKSTESGSHMPMYYEGTLSRRPNGSVAFHPISGGRADYGMLYALASFHDAKHDRRILIGYAPDDGLVNSTFSVLQQGYRGCMSLPRELFVHTVHDVADYHGLADEVGPRTLTRQPNNLFTVTTLGQRPAPDVLAGLRKGATKRTLQPGLFRHSKKLISEGSMHSEFTATLTDVTGPCGFRIAVSPDEREYTSILFNPADNTITVDRSASSLIQEFNLEPHHAYFRPYYVAKAGGPPAMEPLRWHIFLDGSMVEIFINDRFALTTRIYPSLESSTGVGVALENGARANYKDMFYWAGLANIWPDRPRNSSSYLMYDTARQSGNWTWWDGY